MKKEEKINLVKDIIAILPNLIQALITVSFSLAGTYVLIVEVVIIMPPINILDVCLLWIALTVSGFIIVMFWNHLHTPRIKVLDVKKSKDYFGLHVKNVGAKGKVRASLGNNSAGLFKVRWFKFGEEMSGTGGEKERTLERGEENFVVISRRAAIVTGGRTMSDLGWHHIKVRFPETYQVFKYKFHITDGGIKDLEILGSYIERMMR